jgi:hypothetical protein
MLTDKQKKALGLRKWVLADKGLVLYMDEISGKRLYCESEKESKCLSENMFSEMLEALICSAQAFEFYSKDYFEKHGKNSYKYKKNLELFVLTVEAVEKSLDKPWYEIKKILEGNK